MAETTRNDPISQPQAYVKTAVPTSMPIEPEPPVAPAGKPTANMAGTTSHKPETQAKGPSSSSVTATAAIPPTFAPMPVGSATPPTASAPAINTTTSHNEKMSAAPMTPPRKAPSYTVMDKPPARESLWGILNGRHAATSEPVTMVTKPDAATVAKKPEPTTVVKKSEPEPVPAKEPNAPKEHIPMGMGSVMAAGSPTVESAPKVIGKVVVMDGQSQMKPANTATIPGSVSIPVTAPNAFTMAMGAPSGMPGPMMPPGPVMMPGAGPMMPSGMMMAQAAPPGMGNAFTTTGSSRPIPADYGMAENIPNAFEHAGMSPPARPQMAMMPPPGYYPMPMPMPRMPAAVPMAMAQAPLPEPQTGQLIAVLRNSVLPSEREMAVEQLSRYDWRSQPQVVTELTNAAKNDPAATVRASCVHALAKMKVNTVPAVQTVQALKNDKDVRVRQEVEQALAIMSH
jgi:hypothetical protein